MYKHTQKLMFVAGPPDPLLWPCMLTLVLCIGSISRKQQFSTMPFAPITFST